jgi:hypothetical protein
VPAPFDLQSLTPADEGAPSAERVAEYLKVLQRRQSFLIGEAYERRRRGLRAEYEFREVAALTWALGLLERTEAGEESA